MAISSCRVNRDEILRVLRAFESAGLEYVLSGATAMGFHGVVRATEDLDLFIKATVENVERLRAALKAAYDGDPTSTTSLPPTCRASPPRCAPIRRPVTCTTPGIPIRHASAPELTPAVLI